MPNSDDFNTKKHGPLVSSGPLRSDLEETGHIPDSNLRIIARVLAWVLLIALCFITVFLMFILPFWERLPK